MCFLCSFVLRPSPSPSPSLVLALFFFLLLQMVRVFEAGCFSRWSLFVWVFIGLAAIFTQVSLS